MKTMAWHKNEVVISYSNLDTSQNYKVRMSYFNGDAADSFQSIVDRQERKNWGQVPVLKKSISFSIFSENIYVYGDQYFVRGPIFKACILCDDPL